MRTIAILALTAAVLSSAARPATAQSGIQLTPDGKRTLVSKDVGGQRWAISRNPDRTVTGNVFFPGGGPPQFVFCSETGSSETEIRFACSGADACPLAPCEPDEWLFIAEVPLPRSFFGGGVAEAASALAALASPPKAFEERTGLQTASGGAAPAKPSGLQVTPNGAVVLISKDVGDQRWAITRNEDGTVTGNVFFADGGPPQFVWCEPQGAATDPILFRCLGAAACTGGSCGTTDWTLIAEVPLPASFLRARDSVPLMTLVEELVAKFGEDAAFDAVLLALDRGYSLRQIARAALSDRLTGSGEVVERAGGLEAPAGPGLGYFSAVGTSGIERALGGSVTIEQIRAKYKQLSGAVILVALVDLANEGYSMEQLVDLVFLGDARIDLGSRNFPAKLIDASGNTIEPLGSSPAVVSDDEPPNCGNGVRQLGEQCDGADFGTTSCDTLQLPPGTVRCNALCRLDISGCRGQCGDGRQYADEACDGGDLAGESCETLGLGSGSVSCTSACRFETRRCTQCVSGGSACCGQGTRNCNGQCIPTGALCCGQGSKVCNGSCVPNAALCCDQGSQACGNGCIPAAADCCGSSGNYCEAGRICVDGGCCPAGFPVVCNNQCFPAGSACCGNGVREAGEACDGADVGGATCPELGAVRCTSSCTLDTSGCESRCPEHAFPCGNSCAPDGAECCAGTSLFCDGGDVCAFGGGGAVCCPGFAPTLCAGTCYPAGIVCCGSYACAAGSICLGDNQCG